MYTTCINNDPITKYQQLSTTMKCLPQNSSFFSKGSPSFANVTAMGWQDASTVACSACLPGLHATDFCWGWTGCPEMEPTDFGCFTKVSSFCIPDFPACVKFCGMGWNHQPANRRFEVPQFWFSLLWKVLYFLTKRHARHEPNVKRRPAQLASDIFWRFRTSGPTGFAYFWEAKYLDHVCGCIILPPVPWVSPTLLVETLHLAWRGWHLCGMWRRGLCTAYHSWHHRLCGHCNIVFSFWAECGVQNQGSQDVSPRFTAPTKGQPVLGCFDDFRLRGVAWNL